MPIIAIEKDLLWKGLELSDDFTQEDFEQLCFDFGIELDEVTSEKEQLLKETGLASASASDALLYKIDIPANRYDLVCAEGIILALRVFLGLDTLPRFTTVPGPVEIRVDPALKGIRPVLVCGVLRNVRFSAESYASFIDLQEKLHFNICRRRSLASVGTHDLDTVVGPFLYTAHPPQDIAFAPLGTDVVVRGDKLKAHMDEHRPTISKYFPLLNPEAYPLITDAKNRVLSLPPIINSNHSKISLDTRNVLIEVTATDQTKADIVLNTIVCLFSQYCDTPHTVEQVAVTDIDGTVRLTPDLGEREMSASVAWINACIGISLDREQMATILTKMSLRVAPLADGADSDTLVALVPPTRSDILHAADVMEDVAIAHGYDNIKRTVPAVASVGWQQPINRLTDILRNELAQAGFCEILTLSLCSREENYAYLRRPDDDSAVSVANPATIEFQVARTSLLPGMFKTVHHNKSQPKPLKLFEVSDVVLRDSTVDVGARNQRRLCALYCGATTGFEMVQGLLDRVMQVLDVLTPAEKTQREKAAAKALKSGGKAMPVHNMTYRCTLLTEPQPVNTKWTFDNHGASVLITKHGETEEHNIGTIGMVHPETIGSFEIGYPCSAMELDLDLFM